MKKDKKLPVGTSYRLRPDQDAWLREESLRQRHGRKVLVLRQIIDEAMRRRKKAA